MTSLQRKNLISLIAAFGVYLLIVIGDLRGLFGSWGFFPYFAVFLFAARKVLRNCFLNIIRGRVFDINFLMTVAAAAAFATGNYSEAVAVMIFYELGQWFQALAVGKSRNAIADLMELCPDTVTVIKDGAEEEIFPDEAEIGDVVLVRPGERVALDGAIIDGSSSFDCSVMTGESLPVDLPVGASVRGGYLNLSSPVKIRVEKTAENSAAAKIAEAVEVAASRKSRTESAVDAFARIYTPIVALGVLIMITIVPLLVGNFRVWLLRGAACLVAACPCAFVISVPLTFFGAVGCLAKRGVLVKGCEYIEALAKARVFAFDKTGTLTEGNISVVAVHGDVGEIASSAERGSSHPIAKALCRAFGGNLAVSDTVEHPGYGLECVIDGKKVLVGSEKLLRESGIEPETPSETGIVVCVAVDGKFAGSIVLADKVKPTSAAAVRELSRQGRTVMLTGDNPSHAAQWPGKWAWMIFGRVCCLRIRWRSWRLWARARFTWETE